MVVKSLIYIKLVVTKKIYNIFEMCGKSSIGYFYSVGANLGGYRRWWNRVVGGKGV